MAMVTTRVPPWLITPRLEQVPTTSRLEAPEERPKHLWLFQSIHGCLTASELHKNMVIFADIDRIDTRWSLWSSMAKLKCNSTVGVYGRYSRYVEPIKARETKESHISQWGTTLIDCVCDCRIDSNMFITFLSQTHPFWKLILLTPYPGISMWNMGLFHQQVQGICHDKTPAWCHECHDPKGGQNKNSKSKNYYKQTNSIYVTNCNIDLCKQTPNFNFLDLESGFRHLLKDFVDWRTAAWKRREWESRIPWDHQGQVKAWRCLEFREQ